MQNLEKQYHIDCAPGDIGRYCILPGDPGRVPAIAALFDGVGQVEKEHEMRYRKLLANIEQGLVFARQGQTVWICLNCGHIHVGEQAPAICPVCSHPQAYFEIKPENY